MCVIDVDVNSLVWRETKRVARKPHVCDLCSCPIPPKTAYREVVGIFDKRDCGNTFDKLCPACDAARDTFCIEHGGTRLGAESFELFLDEFLSYGREWNDDKWFDMRDAYEWRRKVALTGEMCTAS